ncbi:MAG: hypothetical protein L3J46_03815, partial [Kangiellaceae bacterium]|nr:hypothetical protein [Kangiellaceae bacterium]
MLKVSAHIEEWQFKQPFRITGKEWTSSHGLVVKISDGKKIGLGEAQGVFYMGESVESMLTQFNLVADEL